ncbi:MgtC/SapB family protein [Sphingomonas quercus]|uniref:MgtC/SapB family protein n=1 Tax=Sphingomonas quercus TaxID=2842451 RepID=A0ABS6BHT1_9SPHN|nr:MgtC/SapB family protein [Sphingomonas quercus]MBU3077867.1 MgtC/SapB family protein [Sphingomonas quercus]
MVAGPAAAGAAGLLIGMERGWSQRALAPGRRVAGFRTFGLIGLAGGVAGLAPDMMAAALGLGVMLVLAIGYARSATADALSATTSITGMLTFAIGFAAVHVGPVPALGTAAATFILLSARRSMHALLRGLSETEVEAVARFVLVALVILPLLPDADYGPYGAWNPRRIWMVVVLVAALSFAGYVAARRLGSDHGIVVVALAGAMVSSTAVTADYARRLRGEPEARGALTAGIALASIVMFVRVQVLTAALAPRALPALALAMAPATVVATGLALFVWRRQRATASAAVKLGNPFDFAPALLLAGLVAILSVVARWAQATFGGEGLAVALGLTGMMDVDAAVMALAGLPDSALDGATAGMVLAVPVLTNTAVKGAMTIAIAGWREGGRAAAPLFAALVASLLGLAFTLPR